MHGGGGENSHMQVCLTSINTIMESNGNAGTCTNGTGAYTTDASLWTDHWYLPGPIVFDELPSGLNWVNLLTDLSPLEAQWASV